MSFFIKKKLRNLHGGVNEGDNRTFVTKGKFSSEPKPKLAKLQNSEELQKNDDEEIDSDIEGLNELNDVRDDFQYEEEERETPQEKRIRLAKTYLGEIERQEKERAETDIIDRDVIASRLKDEFLESTGRLKKRVANNYTGYDEANVTYLKCKDQKQSITCFVISSDNLHIYSGSKDSTIVKWSFAERRKLKSIPRGKKDSTDPNCGHLTAVQCLALTTDNSFLVSGSSTNLIFVWNPATLEKLNTLKGHRGAITGLAFQKNTHQLFSASYDRSVKVWSLDEMAYVESLFGHQGPVMGIDALTRERAITAGGTDNSVRIWKVVEESQLVFNGYKGSIDSVKLISEEHFFTCSEDGNLSVWGTMKKRPLTSISNAHGLQQGNQLPNWITSIAAFLNTDLIASGSMDGFIRLWKCTVGFRELVPVMEVPVAGVINALAFTSDGKYLIAGVGQEHRLGRWWVKREARNGICIIPLVINDQNA